MDRQTHVCGQLANPTAELWLVLFDVRITVGQEKFLRETDLVGGFLRFNQLKIGSVKLSFGAKTWGLVRKSATYINVLLIHILMFFKS